MTNKRKRSVLLVVAAVLATGLLAIVLPAGHRTSDHSSGGYVTPSASASRVNSPLPVQTSTDATRRVTDILSQMHQKAFNPDAAPPKNSSGLTGGTYINWAARWDGDPTTAADTTNFQTDGQTDSV